jgi:hypothetical protein
VKQTKLKLKVITIRNIKIDPELLKQVRYIARLEGCSLANLVVDGLYRVVKSNIVPDPIRSRDGRAGRLVNLPAKISGERAIKKRPTRRLTALFPRFDSTLRFYSRGTRQWSCASRAPAHHVLHFGQRRRFFFGPPNVSRRLAV